MKNRKMIFDTKTPLWLGNGVRTFIIGSFVILIVITGILLSAHITSIWKPKIAICPIYLMILPFSIAAIKFLSQLKYYLRLKKVVRAAGLIDYEQDNINQGIKKIVNAVKIEIEQRNNIIYITFLTNGIRNHENVRQLSDILSEVFKMNCNKTDDLFGKVTYKLYKMPEFGDKVSDNDFF